MKLVPHENIDKARWDDVIKNASNGNIFNLSWYLDAVCDNWQAVIYGDYELIMAVPVARKFGVDQVYQPFFARQLGVFGKNQELHPKNFLDFLSTNFSAIEIGFDVIQEVPGPYTARERVYQLLSLDQEYEKIRSNYSNNAKRMIKKQADLVSISKSENIDGLINHFGGLADKKGIRLNADSTQRLRNLMVNCLNQQSGIQYVAEVDGEIVAGVFFMLFRDTVILLKNYTTEKGKELGAMYKLVDEAIRELGDTYSKLDFGGSDVKTVAGFNKKFGSTDAFYLFLSRDQSPLYFRILRSIRNKFRNY